MYVVAIGWMYVVVMASVAEAMSPQGTVLGALMTLIGWGVLPCALVLYILGTPARKRRLREQAAQEAQAAQPPNAPPLVASDAAAGALAQDAAAAQSDQRAQPSPASDQPVSKD